MIAFDELVLALERYKRQKSGVPAAAASPAVSAPRPSSGEGRVQVAATRPSGRDNTFEFSLDEVEEE